MAVMAHHTTYQASLLCGLVEIFHGKTPQNALDLMFANPMHLSNPPTDIWKMLDEVNDKYKRNLHNIVGAHLERSSLYDRKASGDLPKLNDFLFLLNPKY